MKTYRCVKIKTGTLKKVSEIKFNQNSFLELSQSEPYNQITVAMSIATYQLKPKPNEFIGIEVLNSNQ